MSNPVLEFSLTPAQWEQAKAQVQQKLGLSLPGDSGQVSKDGVVVHFEYSADLGHLAMYVVGREFFDPSVATIDQDITEAIQAIQTSPGE